MIDLYCIPYAGGTAKIIYTPWQKYLPSNVRVIPLELAGHGHRIAEPFHRSLHMAVSDMVDKIKARKSTNDYAIYGHSMGSLLAYELCKAVEREGLPGPKTVFVSGRRPPCSCPKSRNIHLLSDDALLREMEKLGGTPKEFFEDDALIRAFLPIFRNDYRLLERYRFVPPIETINANLVFLFSEEDRIVAGGGTEEWAAYTSAQYEACSFPGGHFFINEYRQAVCKRVAESLVDSTFQSMIELVG